MEIGDLLVVIGGISISVIGYFLKTAMDDLKTVKSVSYENKTKIEIIKRENVLHIQRLNEKIELLYDAIDKLNNSIDRLNQKIK